MASKTKPDATRFRPAPWRTRAVWGSVATVLLAAAALTSWWRLGQIPEDQPATNPVRTKRGGNPAGYVGIDACAACHAERVSEFKKTNHFRTARLPDAEPMPEGFSLDKGTYATRDPALKFEMQREGDKYTQTAVRITPGGHERTTKTIGLVYGAGGGDEVYHYWDGGKLFELPVAWMRPLKKWINAPGYRDGTANFSRETAPRCVECHNTWFTHVPGTANEYKPLHSILGVTCERCHGPAREHVEHHEAHPQDDAAHAIVHPGELSREQQMDLCGQCHSNADKRRTPPFSFRPGDKLEDHFRIDIAKQPENDHTANQVHYLRQSKCYQQNQSLSCITCHDPHQPTGPASVAHSSGSCRQCHEPAHCQEQPRLPEAVRGECIGCHMPPRPAMSVYFHTEKDDYVPLISRHEHRIGIYPEARLEVLLAFHRSQPGEEHRGEADKLAKQLGQHWLAEAEKLRGAYRFLAAIGAYRQAVRFDPQPATRQALQEMVRIQSKLDADMNRGIQQSDERKFSAAIETFRQVLAVKPDLALAHGKLGTCYASTGKRDLAIEHLQRSVDLDPDSAYGYSMLGWLAYLEDDADASLEYYRRADAIEPYSAKIKRHLGLALARQDQLPEAIAQFERALEIDPNDADACLSLGQVYQKQRKPAEFLRLALRAANLTRFERLDILLSLADAYADNGRNAEATDTARRALTIAEKDNPAMAQQIRIQLQEFQLRSLRPGK